MDVVFHGGRCCGIKTIFGFEDTDDECYGTDKVSTRNHDKHGDNVRSDLSFFTDEAPDEDCASRFNRLVDFTIRRRPSGVIEAVLAQGVYWKQHDNWADILVEKGFKLVTTAKNSNTNNTIYIYHLVSLDGQIVKE